MEAGAASRTGTAVLLLVRAALLIVCATAPISAAGDAGTPTPLQDDAALHDVQFVGSKDGYAVGDHGVVWRTSDAGASWQFVSTPTRGSLRSVALLTNQVAWIAGVEWVPYARVPVGVLLRTTDGGRTWQPLGDGRLPALEYVRFFDLDEGVVVGRSSPAGPAGVWRTADGGKTWQPVSGPTTQGWRSARFLAPDRGLVVGSQGRVALLAGDELRPARLPSLGQRTIHNVILQPNEQGWLVGDGGLVLVTSTGGASWQSPPGPLPEGTADLCDFRCVEQRGPLVWIGGVPGSVVWLSKDHGQSWTAIPTGQTTPIHQLRFVSDKHGVAVGALGVILVTRDGGQTWQAIRGGGRHAALLVFPPNSHGFAPELLATVALEGGYRSAVHVPVNTAPIEGWAHTDDAEDVLSAAVTEVGGNSADIGRRLSLDVLGLDRDAEKLQARWHLQAEGRAGQLLIRALVRQVRMWRPNVVVVDEPAADDVAAFWIRQAVLTAVRQAADPTRDLHHIHLGGLSAWQVDRVLEQLPPGSQGAFQVNFHTWLPHTGTSAHLRASAARSLWEPELRPRDAMGLRPLTDGAVPERSSDLFSGLDLRPGSAARRELATLSTDPLEHQQRRIQQVRHLTAIAEQAERGTAASAQLVAQWPKALEGWPDAAASALLAEQAQRWRRRGEFEHAEALYLELVRRYPEQPAALDGFRWLLQYWTSAEVAWQRRRRQGITQVRWTNDAERMAQRLELVPTTPAKAQAAPPPLSAAAPRQTVKAVERGLAPRRPPQENAPPDSVAAGRKRAFDLAMQLEQQSPALFQQPSVQWPLAALRRALGSAARADEIYRSQLIGSPDSQARQLAERELWLGAATGAVPRKLITCRVASVRPHLDGLLSDACWQAAEEVRLGVGEQAGPDASAVQGLVMFAYDAEFLYLAASIPRHPAAPQDPPQTAGRTHDADLSRHDALGIALDVDRDYATWYELRIDQRGWTRDRCWEDDGWNPQWYVAAAGDESRWRIEAAIPWNELVEHPPTPREAWGISLSRIIPGVDHIGWEGPARWPPRWDSFGLLRFAPAQP
jgi:photosystem II stability/assembly factor-like uncharacterized protein